MGFSRDLSRAGLRRATHEMKGVSMNSWTRGLSILGLSTLSLFALTACETGEDRTMASAQSCLDGARDAAAAQRCVDIVQGLTTQDAYMVRCSAAFIANGFSGQKIADAYLAISNNNSNTPGQPDPMVSIMAYLNFDSPNPNFTSSAAVQNCQSSGVRSMYQLATAANLSSSLTGLTISGVPPFDPAQPEASIQAIVDAINTQIDNNNVTVDLTDVGNVAIVANQAFCVGVANKNAEICDKLENSISIGGNNPLLIAEELMKYLQ